MSSQQNRFPFLRLPAEIRNTFYRQILLQRDPVLIRKRPALLSTSKRIRDEAVPIYYGENILHLGFYTRGIQGLQDVHRSVHGIPQTIKAHVRRIKFGIHHEVGDVAPYNKHLQLLFSHFPDEFFFPRNKLGRPRAEWADYSLAKKEFSAKVKEGVMLSGGIMKGIGEGVYDGKLLPPALELFKAVWVLAHNFPMAEKSIYSFSHLPIEDCFHIW